MALISSNNPEFFKSRKGNIICEKEFEYYLQPGYVSLSSKTLSKKTRTYLFQTAIDPELTEKCKNSTFYVPESTNDLDKVMANIKTESLPQPIRIWTDYERFNRTHFWSATADRWWSLKDGTISRKSWKSFKDSVLVDGHREVPNNFTISHHT